MSADLIHDILRREGDRYVDDGERCAKYGVTLEQLRDWWPRPVTRGDVQALTRSDALAYYTRLLQRTGIENVGDHALRALVFDSAVAHGTGRAVTWLQRALRPYDEQVEDTGLLGPETYAALAKSDLRRVYAAVLRQRLAYLGQQLSGRGSDHVYAEQWLRRAAEFVR